MPQLKIEIQLDDNGAAAKLNEVNAAVQSIENQSVKTSNVVAGSFGKIADVHANSAAMAVKAASAYETLSKSVGGFLQQAGAMLTGGLLLNLVDGLGEMAVEALRSAGRLQDMATKTGMSVEVLQRLEFVGAQAGVSLEDFSNAAFLLGNNLQKTGSAGEQIAKDLSGIGLSVSDLLAMSPDQRFMEVATALGGMENATDRNRIATELFGKSAKTILPALTEDFGEMADSAVVASEGEIAALDAAGDAISRLELRIRNSVISIVGSFALMAEGAQRTGFFNTAGMFVSGLFNGGVGGAAINMQGLSGVAASAARRSSVDTTALAEAAEWERAVNQIASRQEGAAQAAQRAREAAVRRLSAGASTVHDTLWSLPIMPEEMAATMGLGFMPGTPTFNLPPEIQATKGLNFMPGTALQNESLGVVDLMRSAFGKLGADLPGLLFGALTHGGIAGLVGGLAQALGQTFSDMFQKALKDAGGNLSQVGGGAQALGIAGMGIATAIGGFQLGQQYGKAKGALGGAAAGALAGTYIMPGIGTAIGAGIGALAGFFGGRSRDKKLREQMAQDQQALLQQYGGMAKLKEITDSLGISIGNAFSTNKPQEFAAFVERLNGGLEKQKNTLEGIQMVLEGVNARSAAFGTSMQTAAEKNANDLAARMKSMGINPDSAQGKALTTQSNVAFAATNQDEFNRIGTMAAGTFGEQIATGSSPLQALEALKPTMDVLVPLQQKFNFSLSEGTQRLFEINAAVQANLPTFQALSADGQILNGMLKANWGDMGMLAATSRDVGANIQGLIDKGMPMNQALALNQPTLQALWQAEQQFGFHADQATQSLINQGIQAGIVGPQMLSPQDKMLEVLGLILEQLGGKIPAALQALPGQAAGAAQGMQGAFANFHPTIKPNIDLSGLSGKELEDATRFNDNNTPGFAAGVRNFRGGMAIVGERGPELVNLPRGSSVIPNDRLGGGVAIIVAPRNASEEEILDLVATQYPDAVRLNRSQAATKLRAALEMR